MRTRYARLSPAWASTILSPTTAIVAIVVAISAHRGRRFASSAIAVSARWMAATRRRVTPRLRSVVVRTGGGSGAKWRSTVATASREATAPPPDELTPSATTNRPASARKRSASSFSRRTRPRSVRPAASMDGRGRRDTVGHVSAYATAHPLASARAPRSQARLAPRRRARTRSACPTRRRSRPSSRTRRA